MDGGDVAAANQCIVDEDWTQVFPVEIFGIIGTEAPRRVFENRLGVDQTLIDGESINERLEGRAGLPPCHDAIHVSGLAELIRRSHPGQHFACGVAKYQHRAVFHMPTAQLAQVLLQSLDGKALQGSAQGGRYRRSG